MICCDLFLAWFCNYDFDMVSLLILIWIKIVILMWVKSGLKITWLNLENIPETYQNHIKFAQNRIKTVSKPDQHHIKSYQSHKNPREIDQKPVPGLFSFLVWSQLTGNPEKALRSQTILKPYLNHHLNHIGHITKLYRDIKTRNSKRIKVIS